MLQYMTILFVLALSAADCWAVRPYTPVHPDPVLEPWRWRSFPELDGLELSCIAEDRNGRMWFGADDRVTQYDGVSWSVYAQEDGIYGASARALCAAQDGSVYVGTDLGISRFKSERWSRLFPVGSDFACPIYVLIEASDGSIWAGTEWGALHLAEGIATLHTLEGMKRALQQLLPGVQFSTVPSGSLRPQGWPEGLGVRVHKGVVIALAPGGPAIAKGLQLADRIISGDREPGVTQRRLDGPAGTPVMLTVQRGEQPETFEVTLTRKQIPSTYREFSIRDVYEDREGTIWLGTYWGEIARYSAGKPDYATSWRIYTRNDGLDILGESFVHSGYRPSIIQTQDGTLWTVSRGPGGVNRFNAGSWTHFQLAEHGGSNRGYSLEETRDGALWIGGRGYLHAYRNSRWSVYGTDVLPIRSKQAVPLHLMETADGALWIMRSGQDVFRLDYGTSRWTTYENLTFQCESPDGVQWFVGRDSSVVSHNGQVWVRYDARDGLMDFPEAVICTREGGIWAAGSHDSTAATAEFDGEGWLLKTHPYLSWNIEKRGVYGAPDGALWFSAKYGYTREGDMRGGLLRFQDNTWAHYPARGGPAFPDANGFGSLGDGVLWIGGYRGLLTFDGRTWRTVEEPEALTKPAIQAVYSSQENKLWVGHRSAGLFRYDGKTWVCYDDRVGLADNTIRSIQQGLDGSMFVDTDRGISRFDGQTWTNHVFPSALPLRGYDALRQSPRGALWINTTAGAICYEPDVNPPETKITLSVDRVPQPGNVSLAWTGIDAWNHTPKEGLQFSHCLDGGRWSPFSDATQTVLLTLGSGNHTFRVKARDRDFNEDPTPALAHFTVIPPVWQQPWFVGLMAVLVGTIVVQTYRYLSAKQKLLDEAEAELQTAHDMQMRLMPRESPQAKGLDIEGRCIPANHVGGDFFQHFPLNDTLAVCMADVTGHAMDAAIPVVMFSGVLDRQMELGESIQDTFRNLNRSLHRTLDARTFVCFTMGELDPTSLVFWLCNAGCPSPYHFQAATGQIIELEVGAYPLGVRPNTEYDVLETRLQPGDRIVFCSDGIIEADNAAGEQFGFEQTAETIRKACEDGLSAKATIDRILEAVAAFKGDAVQSDDMTCVVVRVEDA